LKVLVDSSAWADFFNGFPSPEREALATLIPSDHEICTCGVTIRSTIDCVIAVLAEEYGCAVLARDRDMETILESGVLAVDRYPAV
jgi:predicted nucleic acid-binding protein